jgi:hypothetical protein
MLCSHKILEKLSQPFKDRFHFFKIVSVWGVNEHKRGRFLVWLMNLLAFLFSARR